ncbi:unnamed protein product [Caenorhabditis brenneri]
MTDIICNPSKTYFATPEFLKSSVHVITGISLPIHFIGLYIVIFKTPKQMSSVKWYFVNLHSWIVLYDNSLGSLTLPYLLFPSISGYSLGFLAYLGFPYLFMVMLTLWACANMLVSVLAIFENQFHVICEFYWKKYWDRLRRLWLAAHYIIIILIFIPFGFLIPEQNEARKRVFETLPCLPNYIQDAPIYVLTEDPTYHVIFLGSFLAIGCLEEIFFIVCLVWNAVKQSKSRRMSEQTYKLQRKFLLALSFQTGIPALLMVFPLSYKFYSVTQNYYNQAYMNSAMLIEMFHGLVSTLMMIFIHQPYREAFFKMFFRRTPKHSLHKNTRVVQRVGSRPQS